MKHTGRCMISLVLSLVMMMSVSVHAATQSTKSATAIPSYSPVYVNGVQMKFDAYNINKNNYFKLRDIAFVSSGTEVQFNVEWKDAVAITPGQPYTPVGGEMSTGGTTNQIAYPTTSAVLMNGKAVNLTAYNINKNNYFKLRDIADLLGFSVEWDSARQAVVVNTSRSNNATLSQNDIVAPQLDTKALLLGEWFFQYFHADGLYSWTQSVVFDGDGSGSITRTFYLPKEVSGMGYTTSDTAGEGIQDFTWSLSGDTVHVVSGSESFNLAFSSTQQKLSQTNSSGKVFTYARQKFSVPDGYIEKTKVIEDIQAKEASLARRFLGNWYFDVLVWTFNRDGTGVIDIPELGDQPATKRKFTYSLTGDQTNPMMIFAWANTDTDSDTAYFWPKIHEDGSITLQGAKDSNPIELKRIFDINNCPLTEAIISNAMGVFTGSIFSDILPS